MGTRGALKKVYNVEPLGYSKKAVKVWQDLGYVYIEGSWDQVDKSKVLPDIAVLIVRLQRTVNKEVLDKFTSLDTLVSATTGHDHIDIEYLKLKGIKLLSLRGQHEFLNTVPSTAEHTWALLLSLVRKIPASSTHVKNGNWNRDMFRGVQLKGKTLGIVGFGRTGKRVAIYAKAFDMNIKYFDPYVSTNPQNKINDLYALLEISDVVSIHVHLTDKTTNLINKEAVGRLKQGAYLVNTSRGKIWDEDALYNSLLNKSINGVASDVISTELNDIKKSALWLAQKEGLNVIITPHIGGATWDAMWACEEFITTLI